MAYRFALIFACLASVSMTAASAQQHRPVSCDRSLPPFTYQGASLQSLVSDADAVIYARAVSFRADERSDGLDGEYEFQLHWALKGSPSRPITLAALRPYETVPQHYLDLTETHERFDPESVYSFSQTVVEGRRDCEASARFLIGFDYLIFLGLDSFVSFEPVHSPRLDAWYLAVESVTGGPSEY